MRPEALGRAPRAPGPVSSIPAPWGPGPAHSGAGSSQEPCRCRPAAWGGADLLGVGEAPIVSAGGSPGSAVPRDGPQLACAHTSRDRRALSTQEGDVAGCHGLGVPRPCHLAWRGQKGGPHCTAGSLSHPRQARPGLTEEGDGHRMTLCSLVDTELWNFPHLK